MTTTPAKIAKRAATCNATRGAVKAALEAQIQELNNHLAGCIARDISDEMTDNRYYLDGHKERAVTRIDNIKAEIDLLEKALAEVFHE